jgi:integrase/recombinase XerD
MVCTSGEKKGVLQLSVLKCYYQYWDAGTGGLMDKFRVSLSQAIEGYFLAAHARRLSSHTLTDYDRTFRRFEEWLGRDPPLADLGARDIRRFLNSLNGLSDKTVLNYHTGLSALWTWAVKEHLVPEHVVREVEPPRPEEREIVPYTEQDVKAMLAACDRSRRYRRPGKRVCDHERPSALRDRAIILLLVDTGMRASELCGLLVRDLDLTNRRLKVMGKGRKERVLPFSARTAQVMWRYLASRDDVDVRRAYVFATRDGLGMSRFALRRVLERIGERAGVLGVNVHRFRHTFAIQFLRNSGNVFALQRMLGHSTLEMVNRYLAIVQGDVENAHQEASPVANWLL